MSNEELLVKTSVCVCPMQLPSQGLSVTWRAVYNPAFMSLDVIAWPQQGRTRFSRQPRAALLAIRV